MSRRMSGQAVRKRGEDRHHQVGHHGVVGGDAQFARRLDVAPGDAPLEGDDLLAHAPGQRHHLLAGGRQGIAAAAALEQAGAEHLLDRR